MSLRYLLLTLLLFVSCVSPASSKKTNPTDFSIVATVVEVSSQHSTETINTTHPVLPSYCSSPKGTYQEYYCKTAGAAGDTSTVTQGTSFVMTTEIGDKVYSLQGPRLELGEYRVLFSKPSRKDSGSVSFLLKDKKNSPMAVSYKIVGERLKASHLLKTEETR